MQKFSQVGEVRKDHHALALDVQGWTLGRLVVAAADVPKLLSGHEVEIRFVQARGDEVFVGRAGRARLSRSGKAVTFWIENRMTTAPRRAVEAVVTGRVRAARLSTIAPIIDADEVRAIDHDLVRSF